MDIGRCAAMRYRYLSSGKAVQYRYDVDNVAYYLSDEVVAEFRDEICDYREEKEDGSVDVADNVKDLGNGLEVFTTTNPDNNEKNIIFMLHEEHPAFNYFLIDEQMAHEVISDYADAELANTVKQQLYSAAGIAI